MEREKQRTSGGANRVLAAAATVLFITIVAALGWQVYSVVSDEIRVSELAAERARIARDAAALGGSAFEPIPLDGPTLWRNEAASQSKFPEGLYEIDEVDGSTNHFSNNYFGYSFDFPANWEADNRAVPHYTRFFNNDFRIDITVDDVEGAWETPQAFIDITLEPLQDRISFDENFRISSHDVRVVDYSRPVVEGIINDMTHFSYFFITQDTTVYTMQLKTSESNHASKRADFLRTLESLDLFDPEEFDLNSEIEQVDQEFDLRLEHGIHTLNIPAGDFMMGLFVEHDADLEDRKDDLDSSIGLQMIYSPIDSEFAGEYGSQILHMLDHDIMPKISFLFYEGYDGEDNEYVVRNIIGGKYDDSLSDWGENLANLAAPVLVRLGNEMNGDWAKWSLQYNYNDPDLYKLAFTHIVNVLREAGADNVYTVWNPNGNSAPFTQWNHAAMFYPGDEVVDFVGLTHYHFGGRTTTDFVELYEDIYWEYSRLFYEKPMIIGEFGAVERGTDKAQWISDVFEYTAEEFPMIKMAVWFDARHEHEVRRGGPDLRIDTSFESLAAFRRGMNSPNTVNQLDRTFR